MWTGLAWRVSAGHVQAGSRQGADEPSPLAGMCRSRIGGNCLLASSVRAAFVSESQGGDPFFWREFA